MTAAAKAAITAGPKLFTSPWTISMPRFMTDCWIQVRRENPDISERQALRILICLFSGRSSLLKNQVNSISPTPDTYWEMTVASAAPATPLLRPTTNQRSRKIFITADMARNISGVLESPMALSRDAK